jgi:hypothetical protein
MEQYRERFEQKIKQSGDCMIWTGRKDEYGIGQFDLETGKHTSARKMAWILSGGLASEQKVLVRCGRPDCVNPDHLYCIGDDSDTPDVEYGERLGHGQRMIDGEMDEDVSVNRIRRISRRMT